MWDTKYRPLKFADVLGQDGNVQLLKSRLKNGTAFDTSYIFAGAFGRGKTTLSRIHARAMLCMDLDTSDPEPCNVCDNCTTILEDQPGPFVERDAASQGTIDHIRAIVQELDYVLPNAPKRINLFDEAHRMSIAAQDVLLKPLEEKRMVGMFCTTEASKIRGAIRSRCEEYTIRKVTREDVLGRMRMVLKTEGVDCEDDAILTVIDHSGGHVRDVLNKLEMVSQLGPVTLSSVRDYLHLSSVTLYYQLLLSLSDPSQSLELVDQLCEKVAPEEIGPGLAEAAMNTYRLAHKAHADFSFVDRSLAEQVYSQYGDDVVKYAYWFLDQKHTSKLSLARDVVLFSQSVGFLPTSVARPVPPAPRVPTTTILPPPPTPEVSTTSDGEFESDSVDKLEAEVAESIKIGSEPPPPSPPYRIEYTGELDRKACNVPQDRKRASKTQKTQMKVSEKRKTRLPPAQWRSLFESGWQKRSLNSNS